MLEFDRNQTRVHLALEIRVRSGMEPAAPRRLNNTFPSTRPPSFDSIQRNPMSRRLYAPAALRDKFENFDILYTHYCTRIHTGVCAGRRAKRAEKNWDRGCFRPGPALRGLHRAPLPTQNPRELKSRKMLTLFA